MELAEVFNLIKGPENSAIELEFTRDDDVVEVRLIREFASLPTVVSWFRVRVKSRMSQGFGFRVGYRYG